MTATATRSPVAVQPAPIGPPRYSEQYVAGPQMPAAVRRDVDLVLTTWGLEHQAGDGLVLVSKLATFALVHSRSRTIRMVVTRTGASTVRVEVTVSSPVAPQAVAPFPGAYSGAGRWLGLISALAAPWGSEGVGGDKRVWVDLDMPGGPS
ncbi:ATP-binding protein [Streptomyces sp. NPDC058268]|uniref:ATP-binding protein n=1 Tax=Streptomyces sp. NPDC058268 TaxID=3346413 RepID=UPI0036E90D41